MSSEPISAAVERKPIPVTVFTGFLGAGKTSVILGLLKQLPQDYRVVLLKNEYGDIEVDSLLAKESSIAGVSEILNGCMCCTLVGQIQTAMLEIRDKMNPDRIIIESSGSAFPATLAIQIRQLAPEGFSLDAVATVIDSVNFEGYEDSSPTAKLQAKYTDLLLLNKHELVTERALDNVIDHLYTLNEDTPVIRVSKESPLSPSLIFGLDTKLFKKGSEETADWELVSGGKDKATHTDEVETRSVWRGGKQPGNAGDHRGHSHAPGEACDHEAILEHLKISVTTLPTITTDQLNPSPKWRLATILAVPALILALGVPYWYMTTSIERANLPLSDIAKLAGEADLDLRSPIKLGRWDPHSDRVDAVSRLEDVKARLASPPLRDSGARSWYLHQPNQDEAYDILKVGVIDTSGHTLPFTSHPSGSLVIPWPASTDGESASPQENDLTSKALATLIESALETALPASPPEMPARVIAYSPNITLSFVLANEDASLGGAFAEWDIQEALRLHIHPFLRELRDLHRFAIETSILHHAPLKFTPKAAQVVAWNDVGAVDRNDTIFLVTNEEMKSFVNAEAWTLDSGSSRDPVLRFVLFVPTPTQRPLRLEGSQQPVSFLVPQVGGVVLLNPDQHSMGSNGCLGIADLQSSVEEMLGQLSSLLGVPQNAMPHSGTKDSVVDPWQRENLLRRRSVENYRDASSTLQSLRRIVLKAREMQIPHQVEVDVNQAVKALCDARRSSKSSVLETFRNSVAAKRYADAAFFNPAMMAMLYFPDEHKSAVYMPLFAPVAVSIVVALLKELKRKRQLRKEKSGEAKALEINTQKPPTPLGPAETLSRPELEAALQKMPFDIYRVKGLVQLRSGETASDGQLHVLNWAFGRSELTPITLAEVHADMQGAVYKFTLMGARGEVKKQARKLAEALEGEFA